MSKSIEDLKADVQVRLESHFGNEGVAPGQYGAINWGNLLNRVDQALVKIQPVMHTFVPAQYAALVDLVVGLVTTLDHNVNPPAPTPAADPAS